MLQTVKYTHKVSHHWKCVFNKEVEHINLETILAADKKTAWRNPFNIGTAIQHGGISGEEG